MSERTVFVTGAAGFIGRMLCERYLAAGWNVRGVDRATGPSGSAPGPAAPGPAAPGPAADGASGTPGLPPAAEIVAGDVTEAGPWCNAVAGADLVIHTAALVSNTASLAEGWRVNVGGTHRVVRVAAAAGVARLVHFSSAAVYGHHRDGRVDEREPVRLSGAVYGDTKVASEQVVLQAHAAGEISATVVRPTDVYGPGSRPWTILPVQMLRAGQVLLPAHGRGSFVPIYVDDLIDAVVRAGAAGEAAGQVFNLSGGAAVETREFLGHYCRMLGIGPPRTASTPVAVAVAEVMGRALRLAGRPSEANGATMRMLAATGDVSIDKARRLLGWEPAVDLDEGMRRTEEWLRAGGYL